MAATAARAQDDGLPLDLKVCQGCLDALNRYTESWRTLRELEAAGKKLEGEIAYLEGLSPLTTPNFQERIAEKVAKERELEKNRADIEAARGALEKNRAAVEDCIRRRCFTNQPNVFPPATEVNEPCAPCRDLAARIATVREQGRAVARLMVAVTDDLQAAKVARPKARPGADAARLDALIQHLDQQFLTLKRLADTLGVLLRQLEAELAACRQKNCPPTTPQTVSPPPPPATQPGGSPPPRAVCPRCQSKQAELQEAERQLRIHRNTRIRLQQAGADEETLRSNMERIARAQADVIRLRAELDDCIRRYCINGQDRPRPPAPPTEDDEFGMVPPWRGQYFGVEIVVDRGTVTQIERLRPTDVATFETKPDGVAAGVGLLWGYYFSPWNNNVVVGPFASLDFMRQTINHDFAGGSFFGTRTNVLANAGVKVGVVTSPGILVYGLGGLGVLNQDLNINFGGVSTSTNDTILGGTLGIGAAFQPRWLQNYGRPVSMFVQYQHTWWQDAELNAPAASPAFNYTFRRQDDTVKFGFTMPLGTASALPRR